MAEPQTLGLSELNTVLQAWSTKVKQDCRCYPGYRAPFEISLVSVIKEFRKKL